jgi:3'5'-cyclic nucleotide phosphodiesterase
MSVVKLLSRIVAPEEMDDDGEHTASQLHDHTYGITSDPLTCFGCVFSALIHDVDHAGIPNAQLVKENASLARMYKEQSVAEQNSVDIAWGLLMQDRFTNFRAAIFVNREEMTRFRQLVVNSVMATDIMDKQLKELRNVRWEKAFDTRIREERLLEQQMSNHFAIGINRKATIVIEHLIQASDVCHTMQHWHIYRKWNERLYLELYQAFKDGRADNDPTDGWYKGEIGFFDFYIIPLAKKLADCGVFGVSSFEYLNFAIRNRDEWVAKGELLVQEMRQAVDGK